MAMRLLLTMVPVMEFLMALTMDQVTDQAMEVVKVQVAGKNSEQKQHMARSGVLHMANGLWHRKPARG